MDVSRSAFYLVSGNQIVKAGPGRVKQLCVLASSVTTVFGALYDCNTTASFGTLNQFAVVPVTVGNYTIDWACSAAIGASVAPGMTIAISYE
jgi:hypothetical protein